MNKFSLMTLRLFTGLCLATTYLVAEEVPEDNRVKPGSRALAHVEWVKIQEERAEQESKGISDVAELTTPSSTEESSSKSALEVTGMVRGGVHFTSHTGAFHNPILVSAFGDSVELEDGSIWSIAGGDTYKTFNWLTSDLLVITPNHDWFSSYQFRMTNQSTGVSVKCNLTLGPIYNGLFTHWIVAVNYYTQEICLEDGSIWKVTGFDASTFSKWLVNDTVIIGINDGFLSSSRPNILINVNTLSYARASCTW